MTVRKTLIASIAGLGLASMLAATPASAGWHGHGGWGGHRGWGGGAIAASVIGGLALGAIAAGSHHANYGPSYAAEPVYEPECRLEPQPVYTYNGFYLRDRMVRVCD